MNNNKTYILKLLIYSIAYIVPALVLRAVSDRLLCPFHILPVLLFFEHFLTFWCNKMLLTHILPAQCLESAISPRNPGSFYWRMVSPLIFVNKVLFT